MNFRSESCFEFSCFSFRFYTSEPLKCWKRKNFAFKSEIKSRKVFFFGCSFSFYFARRRENYCFQFMFCSFFLSCFLINFARFESLRKNIVREWNLQSVFSFTKAAAPFDLIAIKTHLEQEKSVALRWEVRLRFSFVRPIDNQRSVTTKWWRDFIWK